MLDKLITSKTRLKLLIKFFVLAGNHGHLRGLAGEFQESTNAIRKELNQLSAAGYLERIIVKNKIIYRANTRHTLFDPLQKLIRTYLGIDEIIDQVLDKAGDFSEISFIGDCAKGEDLGIIEILILGKNLDQDYLISIADKISLRIDKQITIKFNEQYSLQRIVLFRI